MITSNSWTEEALCAKLDRAINESDDPRMEAYRIDFHSRDPKMKAQAKKLCFSCPVRKDCLQFALNNTERFGIWGGVDELELRKVQAIDAAGKPFVHANRPIRCPFDGARSTKYLEVIDAKRTRTQVKCTHCGVTFWTRKIINKKQDNW